MLSLVSIGLGDIFIWELEGGMGVRLLDGQALETECRCLHAGITPLHDVSGGVGDMPLRPLVLVGGQQPVGGIACREDPLLSVTTPLKRGTNT